jgi:hypothetical protein
VSASAPRRCAPTRRTASSAAGGEVLLDDLGAGDVAGHEIGGELHPVEAQLQCLRHGLDHEGLGQARHADEQGMAAGQDGGEDAVHHVLLAYDPLGYLGPKPGDGLDQALELAYVVLWGGVGMAALRARCWGVPAI